MRTVFYIISLILITTLAFSQANAASIPIDNPSFELPVLDPDAFPAYPYAYGWIEKDVDTEGSTNTGVFGNTEPNSFDHIVNAHGAQLAFLGSESGNAFEQDLNALYQSDHDYRLTVALGISSRFAPSQSEPLDMVELAFYYRDINDPNVIIDIASQLVDAAAMSSTQLYDYTLYLPELSQDANYVDQQIGIAIRSVGLPGGFWTVENVRLNEFLPLMDAIITKE